MSTLAAQSLRFAERQFEIARFTLDAAFIAYLETTERDDMILCGNALLEAIPRYEAALHKLERERRALNSQPSTQ